VGHLIKIKAFQKPFSVTQ